MLNIGCHLSVSKGFLPMAKEAVSIKASTFQFFTRNPRGSKAKALDPVDIEAFLKYSRQHDLGPILGHASYTLNLAAIKPEQQDYARMIMKDDLARLEKTPGAMYNFHPGRHDDPDSGEAAALVSSILNDVLDEGQTTPVLLETMAGGG